MNTCGIKIADKIFHSAAIRLRIELIGVAKQMRSTYIYSVQRLVLLFSIAIYPVACHCISEKNNVSLAEHIG